MGLNLNTCSGLRNLTGCLLQTFEDSHPFSGKGPTDDNDSSRRSVQHSHTCALLPIKLHIAIGAGAKPSTMFLLLAHVPAERNVQFNMMHN